MQWRLCCQQTIGNSSGSDPTLRNHLGSSWTDASLPVRRTLFTAPTTCPKNIKKGLEWKDLTFSCTGPIVEETTPFSSRLVLETNQLILAEINAPISPTTRMGCAPRVVLLRPGFETSQPAPRSYLIYNAERRITICSPTSCEETLQALGIRLLRY